MYGQGPVAGGTILPATGAAMSFDAMLGAVVGGVTLLFAGLALLKMAPRRARN